MMLPNAGGRQPRAMGIHWCLLSGSHKEWLPSYLSVARMDLDWSQGLRKVDLREVERGEENSLFFHQL